MKLCKNRKKLSIIFSFRNEESNLPILIDRVVSAIKLTDFDYEIIFINDNSTDKSLEILNSERIKNSKIKIINMTRRFGVSPCVIAGFKFAEGDCAIYLDSDLQDPPELIPKMVEEWCKGTLVVHTKRTKRKGESWVKMLITRIAYKVINKLSSINFDENVGDFKLLDRIVYKKLVDLNENDIYLRGLIKWMGYRENTLEYVRDGRHKGVTHMPLFSPGPIKEFLRGILSFSDIPLYFGIIAGFVASLLSAFMIIYVIYVKTIGEAYPGWAGPMVAIFFIGGVILTTNGILGLYVARIYNQIKSRPPFIIESTLGFEASKKDSN